MACNEAVLPSQTPAVQLQLRRLCLTHLLAAARFACFARRPQVLQAAAQACWGVCMPLASTAEGRSIIAESVESIAGLMCEIKCQDTAFQVCSSVVLPMSDWDTSGSSSVANGFGLESITDTVKAAESA